jgi:hypothetical protein
LGGCGGGNGDDKGGGLEGAVAHVQVSLVGKYGIMFFGKRTSRAELLRVKAGQLGDELGWVDSSLQETHLGVLLQLALLWDSLTQLEHLSMLMHVSCT